MKRYFCFFVLGIALLIPLMVQAQNQDAILGKWWNEEKDGQIEIYSCDGKYCGKVIWLQEPNYPANDPEGMGGQPKADRKNPDPAKRRQPILGYNVVWGFTHAGENLWEGGFIYNPREGKTYKCRMTLETSNHLKVMGFLGIALIGKTNNWTRVK